LMLSDCFNELEYLCFLDDEISCYAVLLHMILTLVMNVWPKSVLINPDYRLGIILRFWHRLMIDVGSRSVVVAEVLAYCQAVVRMRLGYEILSDPDVCMGGKDDCPIQKPWRHIRTGLAFQPAHLMSPDGQAQGRLLYGIVLQVVTIPH